VKNFQQYVDLDPSRTQNGYTNPQRTLGVLWLCRPRTSSSRSRLSTDRRSGRKHVNYILGQITRKMAAFIEKKKKINVNQNDQGAVDSVPAVRY
jgi:hypothetical protein